MEGSRTYKSREKWKVAGRIRKVERRMEGCRTDKKSLREKWKVTERIRRV